jgi:uncharacterized paraquat-inducible protein A
MRSQLSPCCDCGHLVSAKANACPSCGRVFRRSQGLAILDAVALALMCLFLGPLAIGLVLLALAEVPRGLALLAGLI